MNRCEAIYATVESHGMDIGKDERCSNPVVSCPKCGLATDSCLECMDDRDDVKQCPECCWTYDNPSHPTPQEHHQALCKARDVIVRARIACAGDGEAIRGVLIDAEAWIARQIEPLAKNLMQEIRGE